MTEHWRKPVRILGIEPSEDVVAIGDQLYQEEEVILQDSADYERMRQGYVCAQCFEPFETPFPPVCGVCGFLVHAEQAQYLGRQFKGKTWVGSRESIDDELSALAEKNDRKAFRPQSSILLPRGVHLD